MNQLANQLEKLLHANSEDKNIRACLDAFTDKALLTLKSTGLLPIAHVRRVSRIRAKRSSERRDLVDGFDSLLAALETDIEDSVQIHIFEAQHTVFEIFTNASATKLLGVLIVRGASITNY